VSTFYIRRNNAIDFSGQTIVTDNDLVMELYENTNKQSYGIEFSAKINIPFVHSSFFANGMFMKAEKELDGTMIKDMQLPEVILNSGLYFDYADFDANIFINYTGTYTNNRFVNPAWVQQYGNFPLGDFIAADMTAGYTFKGNYKKRLFIEIKNMLDKSYMTVAGYPDPGRLFMAGISINK
jgi:outer membrane cobalamin receptor